MQNNTRRSFLWQWFFPVTFFIVFSSSLFAFESFPEFGSLTEKEQEAFADPRLYGGEYSSDVLVFSKPIDWEYIFLSRDLMFDGSAGSISAVHFAIDHRLKIRHNALDWFQFRFNHFNEQNHDRQGANHGVAELVAWPLKWLGFGAYGEASYYKRENDDGVALFFKPVPTHEIRLFNTFVDVTRQKRSDRNDTFENEPYARGIVGRWYSNPKDVSGHAERKAGDFLEYAYRFENRVSWKFPDEMYRYTYEKQLAGVYWSQRFSESTRMNFRIQGDRKFEEKSKTDPTSTVMADDWTFDRLMIYVQLVLYDIGPSQRWELTPGFSYQYRRWSTLRDTLTYNDYVPHLWLKIPGFGTGAYEGYWNFLYDLTYHRKSGGVSIGLPVDKDKAVDQRFTIGYGFVFGEPFEIRLQASFDIDSFGTRDTWESGHIQLRWAM